MPADRRIRIDIEDLGERNDLGEYVPGPVTSYNVWAVVEDQGSTDIEDVSGSSIRSRKAFTVRYNLAIARGSPILMEVVDEYGRRFNVEEVQENSGRRNRRKFIEIVGLAIN